MRDGIPESFDDLVLLAAQARATHAADDEPGLLVETRERLTGLVPGLSTGECEMAYKVAAQNAGVEPVTFEELHDEEERQRRRAFITNHT